MADIEFRDEELEAVIADQKKRQRDVAEVYAKCIRRVSVMDPTKELPTWRYINGLILRRWPSGLERVKKMAWDILTPKAEKAAWMGGRNDLR